ncbi:UNVERIFIED_CONTAM: hypothetical protein Sindi_0911500 [Sesamum indicum]
MQNIILPAEASGAERGNKATNTSNIVENNKDRESHNQQGKHYNKKSSLQTPKLQTNYVGAHNSCNVNVDSGALPLDIFCTFVYAKCYRSSRKILWEELTRISSHNVPWLEGGDFNAILHLNERQGGDIRRPGAMDDFNNMMFDVRLIDVSCEGDPITWTNNRFGRDWTGFSTPNNGLKSSISPESHISPKGSQTITHS